MNKNVLVDTSVIIDFLRRQDKENTVFFQLLNKKYTCYCSIITHTELYSGASIWKNAHAKETLEKTLLAIKMLPLSEDISQTAGKIRAIQHIPIIDAIIAATALAYKLPLATLNRRDFEKIKGVRLFKTP